MKRAGEVLKLLEKGDSRPGGADTLDELPLFAAARPRSHVPQGETPSAVDEALKSINPDNLTPKAALDALYKLKALQTDKRRD